MSHLSFENYPGLGETQKKVYYYSQAVRVGDFVYLSGQGEARARLHDALLVNNVERRNPR